jgi:hypothetical protein
MRRPQAKAREILAVVLSVVVAAVSASDVIGRPARAVDILGVFAGGAGVGAGVARLLGRRRAATAEQKP